MPRRTSVPVSFGHELSTELVGIKEDLNRLQRDARQSGNWKAELAVIDKRLKICELQLKEAREHSTNILAVNFDVDAGTAEKMALAFLERQRQLTASGEQA